MNLLDELIKRAEYQARTINELSALEEGKDVSYSPYVKSLINHTLPDLLLEIKYLKKKIKNI